MERSGQARWLQESQREMLGNNRLKENVGTGSLTLNRFLKGLFLLVAREDGFMYLEKFLTPSKVVRDKQENHLG